MNSSQSTAQSNSPHTAIIGAGIAGSCIAFELVRRGHKVTVFDQKGPEYSTTWCSGGMIAPVAEMLTGGLLDLGLAAKQYYPAFLKQLKQTTGQAPAFVQGILVPLEPDDLRPASTAYFQKMARHAEIEFLESPQSAPGIDLGAWIRDEGCLDPRELLTILHNHLSAQDCLRLEASVDSATSHHGKGVEIQTPSEKLEFDRLVIAAGPRTPDIRGINWPALGPFATDRGTLVRVCNVPSPEHVIYDNRLDGTVYVIPDRDGVRIGATSVAGDTNPDVDMQEVDALLMRAEDIWPVAQGNIDEISVGFRPIGPATTGEPFVGRLPGHPNCWGLLGLHRNGILYAPYLAAKLAEALTQT